MRIAPFSDLTCSNLVCSALAGAGMILVASAASAQGLPSALPSPGLAPESGAVGTVGAPPVAAGAGESGLSSPGGAAAGATTPTTGTATAIGTPNAAGVAAQRR